MPNYEVLKNDMDARQREEDKIESLSGLNEEKRRRRRMETKLYIARDIEGNPNREDLRAIREIEEELKKHPCFIGIAPFGSTMRGYGENYPVYKRIHGTDLDITIIYNDEKLSNKEIIKFHNQVTHSIANINLKRHVHVSFCGLSDKKIEKDIESIKKIENQASNPQHLENSHLIKFLYNASMACSGNKIEEYREEIREKLNKLPAHVKKMTLHSLLKKIFYVEEMSVGKRKRRLPKLAESDHAKIIEQRIIMWRKRIKKIWGL